MERYPWGLLLRALALLHQAENQQQSAAFCVKRPEKDTVAIWQAQALEAVTVRKADVSAANPEA